MTTSTSIERPFAVGDMYTRNDVYRNEPRCSSSPSLTRATARPPGLISTKCSFQYRIAYSETNHSS